MKKTKVKAKKVSKSKTKKKKTASSKKGAIPLLLGTMKINDRLSMDRLEYKNEKYISLKHFAVEKSILLLDSTMQKLVEAYATKADVQNLQGLSDSEKTESEIEAILRLFDIKISPEEDSHVD